MDTTVAGLNKVRCIAPSSSYAGKAVTITDGTLTWEKTISSTSPYDCVFLIPSMPAPAKNTYTIRLHNGDSSASVAYARIFELGFGDSIVIGLYSDDEPVNKAYYATYMYHLPTADASTKGGVEVNKHGLRMTSARIEVNNGSGLAIDEDGKLCYSGSISSYQLTLRNSGHVKATYTDLFDIEVNYRGDFTQAKAAHVIPKIVQMQLYYKDTGSASLVNVIPYRINAYNGYCIISCMHGVFSIKQDWNDWAYDFWYWRSGDTITLKFIE